MKKKVMIFALLLVAATALFAGRYGGDFMMIGAGVRSLGMGGAFVALADDSSAIYWNSGGLSQIRESEASAMHAFLYGNLASYDHLSYIQPLPNEVSIGFNVTRLTVSDIPFFDEKYLIGTNVDQRISDSDYHLPGVPDGKFRSTDDLYQFSFSKNINLNADMGWQFFAIPMEIGLGANVKFIQRKIKDNSGSGTGLDFGIKIKTDMAVLFDEDDFGNLHIGFNFQDIAGTTVRWDTVSENRDKILFNTKFGLAAQQPIPSLDSEIIVAWDKDYVHGGTHHFGVDWSYNEMANLRLGYYDDNFSCGASLNIYGAWLDYALITNPVGITNRLGLRFRF